MNLSDLIQEALRQPVSALPYFVSRKLAELRPDAALLETHDRDFGLTSFASEGQCELQVDASGHPEIRHSWQGPEDGAQAEAANAWLRIGWKGHSLEALRLTWHDLGCPQTGHWLIAESQPVAEAFFEEVCRWSSEVRGEVLVFAGGFWQKDERLYRAIQGATFENLVLAGSLKREIREDLQAFFASRETYEAYGVPWKRGILFVGPPGNGKTHTVKALVNSLGRPCLYVKSFKSRHDTDHANIRDVFERARKQAPCLLVFEDLDSLLDGGNRSFFLNELDGFAANAGIVTLATTNHPERLDPSILNRPSRFDRKYHFELPGPVQRFEYLSLASSQLQERMRLTGAGIERMAAGTEGFSFAYLKELVLSSMMRWIQSRGEMEAIMAGQVTLLRDQMASAPEEPPLVETEVDE